MVTISFKQAASPGNVATLPNVTAIGSSNTNTGTHSTDIANALTGLGTNTFVSVTYTDDQGVAGRLQLVSVSEIRAIL